MKFGKLIAAIAAAGVISVAAFSVQAADPMKIGFVYVGPVGDHGWSYQHDQGRLAVEKAFAGKIKTVFAESVKEGPDAERVIRKMAADGASIVFTTSFGYMNPTLKVAKQFPKVMFEHSTGYKRAKNVSTYNIRFYEGRYVAGVIAGKMTKSNIVGYIASFPIPEVVRGINAFARGLRSVNPKASVKVVWVSTWFDPGKEGDATKALIDQGADMIAQHTDSPAPLKIAQERGVFGFGQASNMITFAPKAQLTASVNNWTDYYTARIKAVMDGSWKSGDVWGGLKSGMLKMAKLNDSVPADVKKLALATIADLKSGKIHAFAGPVKDQSGAVKIAAGKTMTDKELAGMNWYVEGVQGKLPK